MDEEPIEILVQMAEKGEMDPWNIDIVEVTDRFLSELERRKALDLGISGRTLLYAAILVRMKSEYLAVRQPGPADVEGEENGLSWEDGQEGEGALDEPGMARGPIERLEREIQRRLERKHLRKYPVTLIELILELRTLERAERRRHRLRGVPADLLVEAEDVVSIAHEERYFDSASRVMDGWEECGGEGLEPVCLTDLCARLGWKIQDVYVPLLFLMFEGKIELFQEEIFGELLVSRCSAG